MFATPMSVIRIGILLFGLALQGVAKPITVVNLFAFSLHAGKGMDDVWRIIELNRALCPRINDGSNPDSFIWLRLHDGHGWDHVAGLIASDVPAVARCGTDVG
ncbi:MAG: hypothetical protein AAF529_01740 [Pseudomonadota bacterium]